MIKALFFDLDGTLLNSKKKVSSETLATLERCKANGIKLFIATSRSPYSTRQVCGDSILSLFDGIAYCNGGLIVAGGTETCVDICEDIVKNAIELISEYDKLNVALHLNGIYETWALRFPITKANWRSWGAGNCSLLDEFESFSKCVKVLIFYEDLIDSITPIEKQLVSDLERLCKNKAQVYVSDKGTCGQIVAAGVNKKNAIERIRNVLGIEKNELAVFGDDVNDVEMISEYYHSVAMGNAEAVVKTAARYVTLDNNSNGISYAIRNFLRLL